MRARMNNRMKRNLTFQSVENWAVVCICCSPYSIHRTEKKGLRYGFIAAGSNERYMSSYYAYNCYVASKCITVRERKTVTLNDDRLRTTTNCWNSSSGSIFIFKQQKKAQKKERIEYELGIAHTLYEIGRVREYLSRPFICIRRKDGLLRYSYAHTDMTNIWCRVRLVSMCERYMISFRFGNTNMRINSDYIQFDTKLVGSLREIVFTIFHFFSSRLLTFFPSLLCFVDVNSGTEWNRSLEIYTFLVHTSFAFIPRSSYNQHRERKTQNSSQSLLYSLVIIFSLFHLVYEKYS